MTLADVYDALTSKRLYKPAYPHAQAVAEIVAGRGTYFDPDVIDAFCALDAEFMQIARSHTE
jgi:cyclic di-GMP phosphodiesterase